MMCSHCGATTDRWFVAVENGTICSQCLTKALGQVLQQVSAAIVFKQRIVAALTSIDSEDEEPSLMALRAILDPPAPAETPETPEP